MAKSQVLKEIRAPFYYPTADASETLQMTRCLPSMNWGFGHTPVFKDQSYATLAIGWGPLVQLTTLFDITDTEGQIFYDDGYILI